MISKINYSDYGEGLVTLTHDHKIKLFLTEVNNFGFDFTSYIADMVYNQIKNKI